jgi:hypothetical protein
LHGYALISNQREWAQMGATTTAEIKAWKIRQPYVKVGERW